MNAWLEKHRVAVAAALFLLPLAGLILTLDDPGITWDEPHYWASAQLQIEWVHTLLDEGPAVALDRETVRQMWDWNHYFNPHPPIYKEGMALTWSLTRDWLGWVAGFRLSSALLFSTLVALVFLWGTAAWSGVGGLGAALSISLMPRIFGHAHLGATETPLLVFWTLAAIGIWWGVERDRTAGWVLGGIALGLAAGTKFTGLAAFAVPAVWAVWRERGAWPGVALSAATAVLVFMALNPLVWVDAERFFRVWVWESLHRSDYAPMVTYYMGRKWGFDVPWHHVFVMTAAVTPLGILALAGTGSILGLRRRDPLVALGLASAAFVVLLMLLPNAPHHDGVRQFVAVFPFLGLLAGYAFHRAWRTLPAGAFATVAVLALVPPAVQTVRIHPNWLAYYGEAVGGVAGAYARGFETSYWMDVVNEEVLEWMSASLPLRATVVVLGSEVVLQRAQSYGRVRDDLRFTDEPSGDYLLVPESWSVLTPAAREAVEDAVPLYRQEFAGVPLVSIYKLAGSPRATSSEPQEDE